ncbi:transcriptional regulator, AraC family protein [Rhodococcus erythropolis]|nr:transcriptional regulator, AraC family protein [Rhodococcus erythropolis]
MSAVSATPASLPEFVQQWHCEMSETFGGLCPESSVDAAPVGTVSGVSLGDVGAFDISGSPQILRRSARAAKRHGSDLLKICTVRTGSAILRQSDRELTAPPGAMILYDVEHSYALRFDGHWSCTVMTLPRSAVSLTERELNCALERTHDGRRGSGALLENFISGAVASQVDGSAAGLLGDAGVNLASAVLMQGSAPATPGRSTREEILRYALGNLDSPDLSVASIAGALHLSPRTVQRHFGDGDLTLSALIRRERLIRVRRDLTDVSLRGHSISILAARWCFHDAPAFSRAFKAEFGAAPSEVRNSPDSNVRERH